MQQMKGSSADPTFLFGLGIASGIVMAVSAYFQGKAGAAGADALAETGKGFSQYITVVGLCETVALFALVFSMVALG
jgi:V/A-type H+-transporting ATPase subunit K